MKKDKVINLTKHKIESTFEGLDELKKLRDDEHLTDEALDKAILESVDNGNINLFSLGRVYMHLAESLDNLEHKLAVLSAYVVLKVKEKDLTKSNLKQGGEPHEDESDSSGKP